MTSLLVSFRSTDLRVMRISAYNFPAKIELKCISVSFVLKCVHMIFFFREIRECLKLDPDHKECFPFYKVSIIIIIIYNNNNDDDYNNNNNYYYYYDKNYYYNYFYI